TRAVGGRLTKSAIGGKTGYRYQLTRSTGSHFRQYCGDTVYGSNDVNVYELGYLVRIEFGGLGCSANARVRDQNVDLPELFSQSIGGGPNSFRITNVGWQKERARRGCSTLRVSFLFDLLNDFQQSGRWHDRNR